jgi:hypothetical protein
LLSFANQAAATRELGQLVAVVLPQVERMLGCSWAGVYLADNGSLVPIADEDNPSHAHRMPLPEGWARLVGGEMAAGHAGWEALFPRGGAGAMLAGGSARR